MNRFGIASTLGGALALSLSCGDPYAGEVAPAQDAGALDDGRTEDARADDVVAADATPIDAGRTCGWNPVSDGFESFPNGATWARTTVGAGASLASGAAPQGMGASLAAEVVALDGGLARYDTLGATLQVATGSPTQSCASLSFSLFVETVSGKPVGIAAMHLANRNVVSVWVDAGHLELVAQTLDGEVFQTIVRLPLPPGSWHRVDVFHAANGDPPSLVVDGATAALAKPMIVLAAPERIDIGVTHAVAATAARYWIDSVDIR